MSNKSSELSQSKSTPDVDQAILQLRGMLSQQKDKVIMEMVTNCFLHQMSPGFPKLAEVFLIYMERIKDLPQLDTQVVDQVIELLISICTKKMANRSMRALFIISRLMVNPDDAPGNLPIRERFKYSKEVIKRMGVEEHLDNPTNGYIVQKFAAFLMEKFKDAQPAHISIDLEKIGIVDQAEKTILRNQIKDLAYQQNENKELITRAFTELNERGISLATEVERIKGFLGQGRSLGQSFQARNDYGSPNESIFRDQDSPRRGDGLASRFDDTRRRSVSRERPNSRQRLPYLQGKNGNYNTETDYDGRSLLVQGDGDKGRQMMLLEKTIKELSARHDLLSERLNDLDRKAVRGMEILRDNPRAADYKERDRSPGGTSQATKGLPDKEINLIRDDFIGYKREVDHKLDDFSKYKRELDSKLTELTSLRRDVDTRLDDLFTFKRDVDTKLADFIRKNTFEENNKLRSSSVSADSYGIQKEVRDLKDRIRQLEQKILDVKSGSLPPISSGLLRCIVEISSF